MQFEKQKPQLPPTFFVAEIDGATCQTPRAFYASIAKALHFPDHFGKNLDGLADCLADLEWLEKKEVALVILNAKAFLAKASATKRRDVFDIFREASENPIDPERSLRVIGVE